MINKPITTITLTGPQLVAFFRHAQSWAHNAPSTPFDVAFVESLDDAMSSSISGQRCSRTWVESLAQRVLEDDRS
jgi:hypothetical protein